MQISLFQRLSPAHGRGTVESGRPGILGILAFIFLTAANLAGAVEIKLASSLPANSDWGIILDRIAAEWYQVSNGEVTLSVFHGRPGSEEQFLQWLRQNRYQAAVFTSQALNNVAPEIMALSIPLLIRDNDEFDAVLGEVRPLLDSTIEEKGFKNLAWVKAGWIKIFSRSRISVPDDLRKLNLATSPSDKKSSDAFRAMGFKLVGASLSDVPAFLNSGRVDAIYQSPIAVQMSSLYKRANHMLSLNLAPFMGGILMNRQGWESIPQRYREPLQAIVRRAGMEFEESFQRREAEAVDIMRQDGIIYNEISPRETQIWLDDIDARIPGLVDRNVFDKTMYQRILGILQRYRESR
ncbi:MAG: TRAP transporter substrate-binding protein DctP [Treponema sp.]|jgi:TRAP-type C4-dicarboxylate transport system substrate-binding protein|nr:TRAP transporter substrate-binding protein DctP [Treponema sp.]